MVVRGGKRAAGRRRCVTMESGASLGMQQHTEEDGASTEGKSSVCGCVEGRAHVSLPVTYMMFGYVRCGYTVVVFICVCVCVCVCVCRHTDEGHAVSLGISVAGVIFNSGSWFWEERERATRSGGQQALQITGS